MGGSDQTQLDTWRCVLAWAGWLAPLHASLPFAFGWIERHHGRLSAEASLVAVHLLFPVLYVLIGERVDFAFAHWAALLGLNHLAVLAGGLALLAL